MFPSDTEFPFRDRESTADAVADFLRTKIITGAYKAGERLVVDEIAKELGVSQTPVREAIRTLQAEFLLDSQPYRGATVGGAHVSLDEVAEVYALRRLLEGYAAEQAALNYSESDIERLETLVVRMAESNHSYPHGDYWRLHREFHRALLNPASNEGWLQRFIELLWQTSERYRVLYAVGLRRQSFESAHSDHKRLVEAARNRNGELLAQLIYEHIEAIESVVLKGHRRTLVPSVPPEDEAFDDESR